MGSLQQLSTGAGCDCAETAPKAKAGPKKDGLCKLKASQIFCENWVSQEIWERFREDLGIDTKLKF